jgi:propanol-preferring alcohol dehydrogenase
MRAMLLDAPGKPLREAEVAEPKPAPGQLLVRVLACAVCRTDLHVVDGELPEPKLPLVLGHQVVGEVVGEARRVGIPWLGWADGECRYCRSDRENLCERVRFTGYDLDGGYAEYAVADERFCLEVPESYGDVEAAPLLCAGLIGYRALRLAGDVQRLGLYGFGSSAHLIAQVARSEGRRVFAFTRAGDEETQAFARELGAEWAGASDEAPPDQLDAAILFAPVGDLVLPALEALDRGGTLAIAGIHLSDIPVLNYQRHLFQERQVRSVTSNTRSDAREFLAFAGRHRIEVTSPEYPLARAADALGDLSAGRIAGAAVLLV